MRLILCVVSLVVSGSTAFGQTPEIEILKEDLSRTKDPEIRSDLQRQLRILERKQTSSANQGPLLGSGAGLNSGGVSNLLRNGSISGPNGTLNRAGLVTAGGARLGRAGLGLPGGLVVTPSGGIAGNGLVNIRPNAGAIAFPGVAINRAGVSAFGLKFGRAGFGIGGFGWK